MRIAFCTDGIFPKAVGGMQRHSRLLIEALAKYSELEIVVFHPHDDHLFEGFKNIQEILVPGIDVKKNYLRECRAYSVRMYEELLKGEYDIIYSQGLSVWYKSETFSDRLIVNPHGLEPYQAIGFKDKVIAIPFKRVFKKIFKSSRAVVSLGGRLTDILSEVIGKDKLVVLPNATIVDQKIEKDFTLQNGPLRLMFVARFAHNKGIHILIQAIEELNNEGYQGKISYDLAGKGPLYDHYTQNHVIDNVKYWGFISDEDLVQLYKDSHAFVFPTLFEGMPTVVLEAMSKSLPIIVSDVGATAELVDESNGYLITKNSVVELKQAILDFYHASAEEKTAKSESSFQRVKDNFTWKIVAQKHLDFFQKIATK